jgi:hypothetical protein
MKAQTKWFFIGLIGLLIISRLAFALPSAPGITYYSNSSATSGLTNRSIDQKGTITTVVLSANQQDYKWKAYIGNVTGKVALDNANGQSIYDWNLGTSSGGEVYVSRFSNINWNSITCADTSSINTEHAALGISGAAADSINATFNYTTHKPLTVATNPVINGCRSTATYINDQQSNNPMGPAAFFQEVLLKDSSDYMIYSTFIESAHNGYDNQPHDFQLLVAENESATVPTTYFFWVELG